jgi:hypothetical protein
MVIDRLHGIFLQQKKVRSVFKSIEQGYLDISGRRVFVGDRMPSVEDSVGCLAAEDFGDDVLRRLEGAMPTLRFVGDVLAALGGHIIVPDAVRDTFTQADAAHLDNTSREAFCARYHHHTSSVCYTAHPTYPPSYFINSLFAMSSPDELVTLSDGLLPAKSLTSILYGKNNKLKKDNSSPEMVHAEKMVLEMQWRLGRWRRRRLLLRQGGLWRDVWG